MEGLSYSAFASWLSCLLEVWCRASQHLQTSICFLPPPLPAFNKDNKDLLSVCSAQCQALCLPQMDRSMIYPRQAARIEQVSVGGGLSLGSGTVCALLVLIDSQMSYDHLCTWTHHPFLWRRWLLLHLFSNPDEVLGEARGNNCSRLLILFL